LAAAEADTEQERLAAETDKLKFEWEKKMEFEKEKLKQEIRMEAERDKMASEMRKLESVFKLKMELNSAKQKAKQAQADKFRAEREFQKAKDSHNFSQTMGQLASGLLTGLTPVMASGVLNNEDRPYLSSHPLSYEQYGARTISSTSNYRR